MAAPPEDQIVSIAAVFLCLTWISTLLRIYVRASISKLFGLEDWFMIIAQFFFSLTAALAIGGITQSKGRHADEIPIPNITAAMRFWFLTELSYAATTCMLKLSVALFLLRIAKEKTHRMLIYTTMFIVVAVSISYFVFLLFQCSPINFFWTRFEGKSGHCLSATLVGALTYTQSGVSAGADVILAVLPVVIVSRLQMNIRTKLTVISILSMGLIACAAVIIRIPYVKILVDTDDLLYSSTNVVIWSEIEPGLAITAANMATLRPLFQRFFSRSRLWGTSSGKAKSNGHVKPAFAFAARRGYMRNGSKGNVEELGLREMDKNGVTTTVQASEESFEDLELRGETPPEGKKDGKWSNKVHWQNSGDRGKARPESQWPIGISVRQSVKTEVVEKLEEESQPPHVTELADLEDGRRYIGSKSFEMKRERNW